MINVCDGHNRRFQLFFFRGDTPLMTKRGGYILMDHSPSWESAGPC